MLMTENNINLLLSKNQDIKQPQQIEICDIHPFKDHPYKVVFNDEMQELMNSIKEYGILEPLKLRKDVNGYEVISGHRRLDSAMRLGMKSVPATVYEISRDEAAIMLVDSNLHREHILPSEKAFAYKLKLEALSHQGKHYESTSRQTVGRLESADMVSETESGRTVQRYIRLTNLIPEILDLMDLNEIAFSVGVELSYLDETKQYELLEIMEETDHKPSYAQANKMHKDFVSDTLTVDGMEELLSADKPNQREKVSFQINALSKYFNKETTPKMIQEYILKLLEDDFKRKARYRNLDSR